MKRCFLFLFPLCCLFAKEHYFIAIKPNDGSNWSCLNTYNPLPSLEGRYYADPFLLKYKGENYLFFEDYNYKKGVISYVHLNRFPLKAQVALTLPTHLSFPSFFEDKEEIYMVPETYHTRSISLYKCIQFPDRWARERILIQGERFSDPLLFYHEGYYWLFTAINKDKLQIYYAKDLKGKFLSHPINRSFLTGRNAGALFTHEGRRIRPVMDCSKYYGRSIILKEIVLLTPEIFIEKEIARIEPDWAPDLLGTHTYSQNDDYITYDGFIDRSETSQERPTD